MKFSIEEKSLIKKATADVQLCESKLDELQGLRRIMKNACRGYALGEIPIQEAASLVVASAADLDSVQASLRSSVKSVRNEALQSVAEIVAGIRNREVETLASKCKTLESAERQTSEDAGLEPDKFTPSASLLAFRNQHSDKKRSAGGMITVQDLDQLVSNL